MNNKNIKIAGHGFISEGNYEKISIMGSANSKGDICSIKVVVSGNADFNGNLNFENFKVNGDTTIEGHLKAGQVKVNGDLVINGSCEIDKLVVNGDLKVSDSIECNNITIRGGLKGKENLYAQDLDVCGNLKMAGNIECENAKIFGNIKCEGLLTSENIEISPRGRSICKEIGATNIEIGKPKNMGIFNIKLPFINLGTLSCELIEGDFIKLENTKVNNLRGKDIVLISKCEVGNIEYSENVEVSSNSIVKNTTKVN